MWILQRANNMKSLRKICLHSWSWMCKEKCHVNDRPFTIVERKVLIHLVRNSEGVSCFKGIIQTFFKIYSFYINSIVSISLQWNFCILNSTSMYNSSMSDNYWNYLWTWISLNTELSVYDRLSSSYIEMFSLS